MKRHTLEETVKDQTGLEVYELCAVLKIPRETLRRWNQNNRLLVKVILSGYNHEIKGN